MEKNEFHEICIGEPGKSFAEYYRYIAQALGETLQGWQRIRTVVCKLNSFWSSHRTGKWGILVSASQNGANRLPRPSLQTTVKSHLSGRAKLSLEEQQNFS